VTGAAPPNHRVCNQEGSGRPCRSGRPVRDPGLPLTRFNERFQVRAQSGTGGMATVYRATDALTGDDVALKILHDTITTSADRFNQEAALLADLAHPAIVRYVDHGVTPTGDRYLAMEWLAGETLEERLARGPLGVLSGLRLGRRVLEGLAVAHRKGIVHRDIKPANLFLPERDLAQAKVLDFGIARRTADTRRITMTGSSLGTPAYMSPEQVRGVKTLDGRSDIFSLGSVLYECIIGEVAFPGETPLAVLAKICLEDSVSVETRHPDLPASVAALLSRMLAKNPDARPASAADLAQEIGALVDSLVAAGHVTAERMEARPRSIVPHLATAEQRVVSAILVSRPRDEEDIARKEVPPRVGTWDVPTAGRQPSMTDAFDEPMFNRIRETVIPFGARVDVFLGNALAITLVGEGTPTDHAAEAARCVLALKAVLPRVCYAVSTGRTVVGEEALGDLVAATAQLLTTGEAGVIRLDEVTAGLLESRFQVSDAPGAPGGPRQHHLLFEKGLKEAPRTVLGKEIPCIGREREIGTLMGLWQEAIGEPVARAVLVTAPAGAGKSRVRHELLERLQSRSERFQYLIGRGDSIRAGAPFAVLGPALRAAAGLAGGEPADVQQRRLLAHVERHVAPAICRRVAAFIGEIADVPFPDDDLPQLRAARQDPRLMADQTLGAWLDFIEAECKAHPVLIVLEDLHWGDFPSVQLVDAALRTLRERPLMVLGLGRSEVDDKFPGLWVDRDLQRVALAPMTPKSAQKLIQHILGDVPTDKTAWIVERADGNPFYLEELVRAVGEGGGPDVAQALPDTVIGMVQARFDALGPDAKRVLRAAAIFGHNFRPSGVRALVGDEDRSLDRWLDILAQKEIVFPRQGGGTREFVFRHALLEEAAYAMLAPADLVLGHRLAGEFLESKGEREAIVLVNHYEKGGEPKKAAHWCRFAAEQALEANDLAAVIERVERGVRLGAEGDGLGAARVAEAQARFWRGEYREAERAATAGMEVLSGDPRLRATRELVIALGQQSKFEAMEACLGEVRDAPPQQSARGAWLECLIHGASYLMPGGFYDSAGTLLREIETNAQWLEPASRARLAMLHATGAWHDGNQASALAHFESAARSYEALGDRRSVIEVRASVGGILADLGRLEEAEESLAAVLSAAERMHLRFVSAAVLMNLCPLRAFLGDFDASRKAGEQALSLARVQGDPRVEGITLVYLAVSAGLDRHFVEAEAHAQLAREKLQTVRPMLPAALAALAQALLGQGRAHEGLLHAGVAYRLLEDLGRVEDCEALVRLAYAECLEAVGDTNEARLVLSRAVIRLNERAASIENAEWRETFLSRLPSHAQTLASYRRLG
jgi:serine/threonine protein kinase/tetratricopeptide (TPR) repeat protein